MKPIALPVFVSTYDHKLQCRRQLQPESALLVSLKGK